MTKKKTRKMRKTSMLLTAMIRMKMNGMMKKPMKSMMRKSMRIKLLMLMMKDGFVLMKIPSMLLTEC